MLFKSAQATLFTCLLFVVPLLNAQEFQLVSDDPIEFDSENKTMTATGEAALTYGDLKLLANKIVYNQETGVAVATGDIRITQEGYRLTAETMTVDVESQNVEAHNVRFGAHPIYAEAEYATGSEKRVELHNAKVYYREPEKYAPHMVMEKFVIDENRIVDADKVLLKVLELPVWYMPSLNLPTNVVPFQIEAQLGSRGNLGVYAQTQILVPLNEKLFVGGNLDLYSKRGILFGPAFRYRNKSNDGFTKIDFSSGYIHDTGELGNDMFGRSIGKDRYFVEGSIQTVWKEDHMLHGTWNIMSDTEIVRDYHYGDFYRNQQPDNFFEYIFQKQNWSLSAFARYDPNGFPVSNYINYYDPVPPSQKPYYDYESFRVQEALPEVRVDMHPNHIGGGVYHKLSASVSRKSHKILGRFENLEADYTLFDLYYGFNKQVQLGKGVNLHLVAGARHIDWQDLPIFTNASTDLPGTVTTAFPLRVWDNWAGTAGQWATTRYDASTTVGDIGFDLESVFSRNWDKQYKTWKIDGIKHIIKPYLSVRYNPANSSNIPSDFGLFRWGTRDTNAPNWDLATRRDLLNITEQTVARVGIKNQILTRKKDYGSRELLNWNLFTDYFFDHPTIDGMSFVYSDFSYTPADWLEVGFFQRFDRDNLKLKEWNTRIRIMDADQWHVEYQNSYAALNRGFGYLGLPAFSSGPPIWPQLDLNQHSIEAGFKINDRFRFLGLWRYDMVSSKLTEQHYGIFQKFGNSVELEYRVSFREDARREGDWAVRVGLNILSF